MANKLYEEGAILNIARAIREKNGSTETYTVSEMPAAIRALEIGGGISIPGFNVTGGKFYITGNNNTEAARTITHGLTNSSGQPITPQTIYIFDPLRTFTMTGPNAYTSTIQYDTIAAKYYRRTVGNSQRANTLVDSTSDTTGLVVNNTTFVLPNIMYYVMHNFFWIAVGSDSSGTTPITCTGGYVNV